MTVPEFLSELEQELGESSIRIRTDSGTELVHGFFKRESKDGTKSYVVFVADDDSWLSNELLTDQDKVNYVPAFVSDCELELSGVELDELISIKALRYANNFETWGQKTIAISDVADLGDRLSIPINRDNAGASKHLRVIEIRYSTSLPP